MTLDTKRTGGCKLTRLGGDGPEGLSRVKSPRYCRARHERQDRTARLWDATTGEEITRIVLDAWVTGLGVYGGMIALGDALGRIHVFDSHEFLSGKRSATG